MQKIETATVFQAQRLDQLMRLNKQFETAMTHKDMDVRIDNSEGSFQFHLDNHQRFTFYRMLRGRLNSMKNEGLGSIGYQLVGSKFYIP